LILLFGGAFQVRYDKQKSGRGEGKKDVTFMREGSSSRADVETNLSIYTSEEKAPTKKKKQGCSVFIGRKKEGKIPSRGRRSPNGFFTGG